MKTNDAEEKKKKFELTDRKKKILKMIAVFLLFIIVIVAVNKYNYNEYKKISKIVNDNSKELEVIAKEYLQGKQVDFPNYIDEIKVYKDKKTVEFYIEGTGLVMNSIYYGFYYNVEDKPVSYKNEYKLKQLRKNEWMWKDKGDNTGKTFKIKNNWYYFEASF